MENKHILSLSTDLLKPYTNYLHTLNFKINVTIPNIIKQKGDLYSINNTDSTLSAFPVTKTKKNLHFILNQSLYNKEDLTQILNHKINQSIIYDNDGDSKLSDLENELILYYKYGSLSNRILYNHQENMIINSSSSVSYSQNDFTSDIYYSYSKDTSSVSSKSESYSYSDLPNAEALTLKLSYKFNKYYTIKYKDEYDLIVEVSKKKEYVFNINKRCWSLDITLADNLVASATENNSAIRQNIFYLQATLKPIWTIKQKYIQKIARD